MKALKLLTEEIIKEGAIINSSKLSSDVVKQLQDYMDGVNIQISNKFGTYPLELSIAKDNIMFTLDKGFAGIDKVSKDTDRIWDDIIEILTANDIKLKKPKFNDNYSTNFTIKKNKGIKVPKTTAEFYTALKALKLTKSDMYDLDNFVMTIDETIPSGWERQYKGKIPYNDIYELAKSLGLLKSGTKRAKSKLVDLLDSENRHQNTILGIDNL